jgi:hypothetical protein
MKRGEIEMAILFKSNKWVEYMCSHCGAKAQRREGTGKPTPGICSRRGKTNAGISKPHVWVVNRKF